MKYHPHLGQMLVSIRNKEKQPLSTASVGSEEPQPPVVPGYWGLVRPPSRLDTRPDDGVVGSEKSQPPAVASVGRPASAEVRKRAASAEGRQRPESTQPTPPIGSPKKLSALDEVPSSPRSDAGQHQEQGKTTLSTASVGSEEPQPPVVPGYWGLVRPPSRLDTRPDDGVVGSEKSQPPAVASVGRPASAEVRKRAASAEGRQRPESTQPTPPIGSPKKLSALDEVPSSPRSDAGQHQEQGKTTPSTASVGSEKPQPPVVPGYWGLVRPPSRLDTRPDDGVVGSEKSQPPAVASVGRPASAEVRKRAASAEGRQRPESTVQFPSVGSSRDSSPRSNPFNLK
jgi:hypothetical protein